MLGNPLYVSIKGDQFVEHKLSGVYKDGGEIIKEWNNLGLYYFQTKNGVYNVEFADNQMTIRNDNGEVVKILKRDRSIGGVSDRVIISEFLSGSTYADGGKTPYIVIYKEWDEDRNVAQHSYPVNAKTKEEAKEKFWRIYNDSDVDIVHIEKTNASYAKGGKVEGFIKVSELKEYLLKDDVNSKDSYKTVNGDKYVKQSSLRTYMKNDTYAEGREINTKVDALKKGDTISIEFGSSL